MQFSKHSYLYVLLHFLLLAIILVGGSYLGWLPIKWVIIKLAPWDPSWYRNIAVNGYSYNASEQSSVAFFPMFPLLWRLLGVGEYGMSLVNLLLLVSGLVIIAKQYKLNSAEALFISATSGFFYCFLPYSEAVFFFTSVILLVGYNRNSLFITVLGVLLASISRSAAVVFIPSIVLVELLTWQQGQTYNKVMRALTLLGACMAGIVIVAYIQFVDTGEWFVFGTASKMWNKRLQFPTLPLKTWDNLRMLFYDTAALAAGLIAGFVLVFFLIRKLINRVAIYKPDLVFSLAYLGGMALIALIYGVQGEHETYINSLNRYIFCTSFFAVPVIYQLRTTNTSIPMILLCLIVGAVACLLVGYPFNPYGADKQAIAWIDVIGILSVCVLFPLLRSAATLQYLLLAFYLFQTSLQIHFFQLYLYQYWVG